MRLRRLNSGRLVVALNVLRQAVTAAIGWRWFEFSLHWLWQGGPWHSDKGRSGSTRGSGAEEKASTGWFR